MFLFFGVWVFVKILFIQWGASSYELKSKAGAMAFDSLKVEAVRGNILSDDGRTLVTSLPFYDLRMDFKVPGMADSIYLSSVGGLAASLADFFGGDSTEYREKLDYGRDKGKRYYSIAPRRVNHIELQQIESFPFINLGVRLSGFRAIPYYKRVNPYDDLAGRTLGFVNSDGVTVGIDGAYDDVLRGIAGFTVKQKISGNFWIPIESDLNIEPTNGYDVNSTINIEIQEIAQRALEEQVEKIDADWGTIVVMEVATGDIKAIANATNFRENGGIVEDYNYAVGSSMEPGSTFKLPALMTMLEDGKITMNSRFNTAERGEEVRRANITDTHHGGNITMSEIFYNSSNIGMAKAVNATYKGRESEFVEDITSMGIGRELGLQIMGEPRPTVKNPKVRSSGWDGTSLMRMSFGYAITVTPLQTLAFYNAVANDGKMMRPRFVKSLSQKGETIEEYPVSVINEQVASPQVVKTAQAALLSVVEEGTAKSLQNDKFKVAAKTGTAWVAVGRSGYRLKDGTTNYLGSIAGYFPADNPKYSMIVAMKTYSRPGSGRTYYGAGLAAPVFKKVSEEVYDANFGFEAPKHSAGSYDPARERKARVVVKKDENGIPQVEGLKFNDAVDVLEKAGYKVRSIGYGVVKSQSVEANNCICLHLAPQK